MTSQHSYVQKRAYVRKIINYYERLEHEYHLQALSLKNSTSVSEEGAGPVQ
jgi:hypothetical protein